MLRTKFIEKIKTHILRSVTFFFRKSYCLRDVGCCLPTFRGDLSVPFSRIK